MSEDELYDEAFRQMGSAPLEPGETQPVDRRRYNRGSRGNRGGGRPRRKRVLIIDGIQQDGCFVLIEMTADSIIVETVCP